MADSGKPSAEAYNASSVAGGKTHEGAQLPERTAGVPGSYSQLAFQLRQARYWMEQAEITVARPEGEVAADSRRSSPAFTAVIRRQLDGMASSASQLRDSLCPGAREAAAGG
jgi:hypothetical protein